MTPPHRPIASAAALVGILVMLLAGCAKQASAGQPAEEAIQRLEALPGVETAMVTVDSFVTGFTRYWSTDVEIALSDGYSVGDADAALDWSLRTAWSINDEQPTNMISIEFTDSSGSPADWDLEGAIARLGPDSGEIRQFSDQKGFFYVKSEDAVKLFGDWPGDVPEIPNSVLVSE